MLNSKQRSNLRSQASVIEPVGQVGKNSITENVIKTFDEALEARELIKITVLETHEQTAKETGAELAEKLKAEFVCAIGRKVVLYRRSKKQNVNHIEY